MNKYKIHIVFLKNVVVFLIFAAKKYQEIVTLLLILRTFTV